MKPQSEIQAKLVALTPIPPKGVGGFLGSNPLRIGYKLLLGYSCRAIIRLY